MKIGILTFHKTLNYGAIMQAYALQNFLTLRGYKCELIDYENPYIKKQYSSRFKDQPKTMKSIAKWILTFHEHKKKQGCFQKFMNEHMLVSRCKYDEDHLFYNDYDAIIVGSDQVWNLELTHNDYQYFLPCSENLELKKISYAASFGSIANIDKDKQSLICAYLRKFNHVSVRELEAQSYLKEMDFQQTSLMIDPTFLFRESDYMQLFQTYKIPKKYILLYIQGKTEHIISFAYALSKKVNIPILSIDASYRKYKGMTSINCASPQQFLYLIAHANYVVTSSFHGLALSLNLKTEVFYELNQKKANNYSSRLQSLATLFNIDQYEITESHCNDQTTKALNSIQWDNVSDIHEKLKEEAVNYLENALCDLNE